MDSETLLRLRATLVADDPEEVVSWISRRLSAVLADLVADQTGDRWPDLLDGATGSVSESLSVGHIRIVPAANLFGLFELLRAAQRADPTMRTALMVVAICGQVTLSDDQWNVMQACDRVASNHGRSSTTKPTLGRAPLTILQTLVSVGADDTLRKAYLGQHSELRAHVRALQTTMADSGTRRSQGVVLYARILARLSTLILSDEHGDQIDFLSEVFSESELRDLTRTRRYLDECAAHLGTAMALGGFGEHADERCTEEFFERLEADGPLAARVWLRGQRSTHFVAPSVAERLDRIAQNIQ